MSEHNLEEIFERLSKQKKEGKIESWIYDENTGSLKIKLSSTMFNKINDMLRSGK